MASTKIRLLNPETGNVGEVDADRVPEAISAGAQLVDEIELYNPETGGVGKVSPEQARDALAAGALPVGSRAHTVATTGKLESGARGLAQGVTMGWFDELQAGLRAPFSDRTYEQIRDEYRADDKIAEEANPWTFKGAEIGGGIGSALIPGLGIAKAAKGATAAMTLGREALLGAKLGAVAGAGYSEKDSLPEVASDAISGGISGGALGAGFNVAGKALGAVAKPIATQLRQSFDPTVQRMLALGAKSRDLLGIRGSKVEEAVETANRLGLFKPEQGSLPPNLNELVTRMEGMRAGAADGMSEIFTKVKGMRIGVDDVIDEGLTAKLDDIMRNAPPDERAKLASTISEVMDDVIKSEGDLAKLWQVKKNTGRWVGPDWERAANRLPSESEAYQAINQTLGSKLEQVTENIATSTNNSTLRELNQQYGAMATLQDMARKQEAAGLWQASAGGFRVRDWVTGLGASAVGGPVAGFVGAAASKAYGSTPGRLLRAQIGEKLHIGQQQQAAAAGAIPRSLSGLKQWLVGKEQLVDQFAPGLRPELQRILQSPEARAEVELRAIMPMFQQFMAPSPYQSEFNGKVSAPQDRLAITNQLQEMKLKPSELALRLSMLNKDGTIPPEVYAPPEQYGDQLETFASRLMAMGY